MASRRAFLAMIVASPGLAGAQAPAASSAEKDWVCPMDPDVRSASPGVCPRCGMKLVLGIPDRKEYSLEVTQAPELLKPGDRAHLCFRIVDPNNNSLVRRFDIVHEKLIHLFVVSENLEFFAHVHPVAQPDGTFVLDIGLPLPGMYRLLADFYPTGSVPQLSAATIFVAGAAPSSHLSASLAPCKAQNLTASLRMEPEVPLAGLETKLFFTLEPSDQLQLYLGAWAHMLAASADLIDLIHLHPFLANGTGRMQFNAIFPRPGLYRVWTQFQRAGEVNTTVFTIPVQAL